MKDDTIVGTPRWDAWLSEIRRTKKLYTKEFMPRQVILDEKDELKGLLVLHKEVEAVEEVGNKAQDGQVLFWFGDYGPGEGAARHGCWNGYDMKRNVYLVGPDTAEMFTQAELDADPQGTIRKLETVASPVL